MDTTEIKIFQSIKAQKLYTQIVEQFVELIKLGEFQAGQKLPSERVLSQNLNVSRTSLREALIALHMMGVLEIKPHQGTYISDKKVPPILKEVTYINLGESPFLILQARKAIEPNIAAIAAANRDQNSLKEIEEIIVYMKNDVSHFQIDVNDFNDHDCAFHLAVAKATQNPVLIGIGYIINKLMKQELWMTLLKDTINSTQIGQQVGLSDHEEVYKAIQLRRPQVASAAMKAHLMRVEKVAKEADLIMGNNFAAENRDGIPGQLEKETRQNARQEILKGQEVK
jgi:GntR family transcriptional repressor for pyruvate dehydrogenase complex